MSHPAGRLFLLLALAVAVADPTSGQPDADRPYDVTTDGPTRKPQIVAAVSKGDLSIAWHARAGKEPGGTVHVAKVAAAAVGKGELKAVRSVASPGQLVGFAVDETGKDYVFCAKREEFPNKPEGDFLTAVDKPWRPGVAVLYAAGKPTDLNAAKFASRPLYGLTNAGAGRLAVGPRFLAATFSRRAYSPGDGLIHQEANDLLADRSLATVPVKAGNVVSHSFDQRLIFDGTDFVTLHAGDVYPYPGLIMEKMRLQPGKLGRLPVFTCPTFGNDIFFELGGVAAEPDCYPVLFAATRNTAAATAENAGALRGKAWDLAMVVVNRDFDLRPLPANPFDLLASGALAKGYAADQEFTVNGFTWDPKTSKYDKPDPRTIRRRVAWLTEHPDGVRATAAKLVRLSAGQYAAVWEEHKGGGRNSYVTTRAAVIEVTGKGGTKAVKKAKEAELPGVRLHLGDDAVMLPINGGPAAAWVTAGAGPKELTLNTLDRGLTHTVHPLRLP